MTRPTDESGVSQSIAMAMRDLLQAGREARGAMGARLGVGETDLLAMDHIAREPKRLGPVELGRRLSITSASATVLVDRLVAAGHLHRVRHEHDGRRIELEPTPSALADIHAVVHPMVEGIDRVTAGLDPAQAQIVLDFLIRATAMLREYAAEPVEDGGD